MGDAGEAIGGLIGLGVGLYVAKKVFDVIEDKDGFKCGICGKTWANKIDAQNCCLAKKEARRRATPATKTNNNVTAPSLVKRGSNFGGVFG